MRRDYILTNARGIYGVPMREYVFGYLLERERHIIQRYLSQQTGRWDETMHGTLRGKQIGLLGVGSIGAELARTAKHFGMRVRGYTRASESCPDVDDLLPSSRTSWLLPPAWITWFAFYRSLVPRRSW